MTATSFSRGWVWMSVLFFTGVELIVGGVIAPMLAGRFVSHVLLLRLEVLAILVSYLAGAFAIGLFSPSVRVIEPAVGAGLSALLPFLIGIFSPVRYFHFDGTRPLWAVAIAAFVGFMGADAGERFAAKMGNTESRYYSGPEK